MTYVPTGTAFRGIPNIPGFTPPTINGANSAVDYLAATGGAAPKAASWMGGIGESAAAAGGLGGRAAGFIRGPFGPAALGTLGSMGIKALPLGEGASSTQDVLANAVQGAGIASSIGAFLAPETAGASLLIAPAAGALLGGGATILSNIFGGGEEGPKKSLKDTIGATAQAYGYSQDQYKNRFDALVKTGMTDAQGNKLTQEQIANQLVNSIWQEKADERLRNEQSEMAKVMHQADLQNGLALQKQAADFFGPYANNLVAAGAAQAQVLNNLAESVPAAYKPMFQAQAATALNSTQQMAGAYMNQIALQPSQMAQAQTQSAAASQIADLSKVYQYASQMAGRQGAGGTGQIDWSSLGGGIPGQ